MDISGEFALHAPPQKVWEALNEAEILGRCIPGCEEISWTGTNAMKARVVSKIGPIKVSLAGTVTLTELDPPNSYVISGSGNGGAAGAVKGACRVRLVARGEQTVLSYKADAQINGKLLQLGARLMDSFVKKTATEFFSRFAEIVNSVPARASASDR